MILKRTFQRRSTLGKDENLVEHSSETAQRYFSICFQWDALLFWNSRISTVTRSVRSRVGDDITQPQEDDGNVRNCSTLHIVFFGNKFLTSKVKKPRVLQARSFPEGFAEKFLCWFQAQSWKYKRFTHMTYVWKHKRTYSSVAWRMCGSARAHPAAKHDVRAEVQEHIQQRSMTYVWNAREHPAA